MKDTIPARLVHLFSLDTASHEVIACCAAVDLYDSFVLHFIFAWFRHIPVPGSGGPYLFMQNYMHNNQKRNCSTVSQMAHWLTGVQWYMLVKARVVMVSQLVTVHNQTVTSK